MPGTHWSSTQIRSAGQSSVVLHGGGGESGYVASSPSRSNRTSSRMHPGRCIRASSIPLAVSCAVTGRGLLLWNVTSRELVRSIPLGDVTSMILLEGGIAAVAGGKGGLSVSDCLECLLRR